MTEEGIKEFPIIPGMETEEYFKMFFIENNKTFLLNLCACKNFLVFDAKIN